jgi:hypothetical protein
MWSGGIIRCVAGGHEERDLIGGPTGSEMAGRTGSTAEGLCWCRLLTLRLAGRSALRVRTQQTRSGAISGLSTKATRAGCPIEVNRPFYCVKLSTSAVGGRQRRDGGLDVLRQRRPRGAEAGQFKVGRWSRGAAPVSNSSSPAGKQRNREGIGPCDLFGR